MIHGKLQVGSMWTVDEYKTQYSTLQYQYRVVCEQDYFGQACTEFCRPRNDVFGHWNCDSRGQKVCLPGWKNYDETDDYCSAGKLILMFTSAFNIIYLRFSKYRVIFPSLQSCSPFFNF